MINVRTVSVATSKTAIALNCKASRVMVKNFSEADIWVSVDADATKTSGAIRIPAAAGQIIVINDNNVWDNGTIETLYVWADAASTDTIEIQAIAY